MPEGQSLSTAWRVVVAQWPVGHGTSPCVHDSIDSVAGRVSRVNVFKGEAIVPGRLAPVGTGSGPRGARSRRANVPCRFASTTCRRLAGMVQPNSRVDILLVIETQAKRVAKLFMENMRVLAIGAVPDRTSDGRPINAAVATLEVTPEEAERLAIATAQGPMQLVLRGYGDHKTDGMGRGTPDSTPLGRTRDPLPIQRGTFGCQRDSGLVRDLLLRSCSTQQFIRDSTGITEPALKVRRPES